MSSEYEQQQSRLLDEQTEQPSDEPWANLELTLPHNRSPTAIVSLVECALVELTHEDVGAEYVSTSSVGVKRTQFISVDDVGETFQKRHFDDRLGWQKTIVSRKRVRDELITRLTRSASVLSGESRDGEEADSGFFTIKSTGELQRHLSQS